MSEEKKVMGKVRYTVTMQNQAPRSGYTEWVGYSSREMDLKDFHETIRMMNLNLHGLTLWSEDGLTCDLIPVKILKQAAAKVEFLPNWVKP